MAIVPRPSVDPGTRLTWNEIQQRYPDQWVVLVDMDYLDDTDLDLRSGIVIGHGARRTDALAQSASPLDRYDGFGLFYTGRIRAPMRTYLAP
jgi:hypothetical protein